jgi:hypothetical protein
MHAWKEPFLNIRDKFSALHHAGLAFHHRLLGATIDDPLQYWPVTANLAVELRGENILRTIPVSTPNLVSHFHLFYGLNSRAVEHFANALSGLERCVSQIPQNLVPSILLPDGHDQPTRDLVLWMSMVYSIAWEVDAAYLPVSVNCMIKHDDEGTYSWNHLQKPEDSDPRPWLVHQTIGLDGFNNLIDQYDSHQLSFPEIIFGALEREVVESSIAAIDLLVFRIGHEACDEQPTDLKQDRKRRYRTGVEVWLLKGVLAEHHNFEINREKALAPMTQEEIMEVLGWSQAKVSRFMAHIFGPNPMRAYRSCWADDELKDRLENPIVPAVDPTDD